MPSKKISTHFIITLHIFSHFAKTFNLHKVNWLCLTLVTCISLAIYRLQSVHSFSIQSCRSCYTRLYLCQRPFYKILVKVRNSKKNVLKIVIIIVNINKDENKSLISNQFSLKNDSPLPPHFLENYRRFGVNAATPLIVVSITYIVEWVFSLFSFVFCSVFPVSLDCTFLIAPSVFSNVYILVSI
jgi:hypothetical protein